MAAILDHVFLCTAFGAPGADLLRAFGLVEGPPNRHPGQGTACRRFFFRNGMLELIWVEDETEARATPETRLWERWSGAGRSASPFGIILGPAPESAAECPFPSWQYRPPMMPDLVLEVASETALEEPMWCFIAVPRSVIHPANSCDITQLRISGPPLSQDCVTRKMAATGCLGLSTGAEHQMEIELDGGVQGKQADFRPDLPLVIRT